MEGMKRLLTVSPKIIVLALALSLAPGVSGAQAGQPTEDIKHLLDEVLAILHNPALKTPAQKQHRQDLIEQAAARRFDYREMAKRCLDTTWDTLSQTQQKEYVHLFTELLKASYAHRVDEIANAQVTYLSESQGQDLAEVRTVILRPNDKIPVNFRMLRLPDGWKIYDLVIEDVSLVKNFNHQFGCAIEGDSYDYLVRCLRGKLQEEKGN